jgi:hypothetical protein
MTGRRTWLNVALVMVSVTTSLLVAEGVVRLFVPNQTRDAEFVFFQYDAVLGWTNKPNSDGPFRVPGVMTHVHINSQGWRDRESPPVSPAQTRILVLGDSQTWGYGVEDDERYTDELQRLRPDARVLNMGVSGYGTAQEYLQLQQKVDDYKPDLVIVGFYHNDLIDNVSDNNDDPFAYPRPVLAPSGETVTLRNVPVPKRERLWQQAPSSYDRYSLPIRWLLQHSLLFASVARPAAASIDALAIRLGWKPEIGAASANPESAPWRTTFAIFRAMKADLDARHVQLLIVVIPAKYHVQHGLTFVEDNMRRWGAENQVAVLTPADQFRQTDIGALFLRYDSHLSPAGHKRLGDLINDALGAK